MFLFSYNNCGKAVACTVRRLGLLCFLQFSPLFPDYAFYAYPSTAVLREFSNLL